jgi:hypothetical protein
MYTILLTVIEGIRSRLWGREIDPVAVFAEGFPMRETSVKRSERQVYDLARPEIAFTQEVRRRYGAYVYAAVLNKLCGIAQELMLPTVPAEVVDATTTQALRELAVEFRVKL